MKLTADLGRHSYDIIVKRGALFKAHLLTNLTGKVMLVTDEGIPTDYVKTLASQCAAPVVHTLTAGEDSKTLEAVAGLHRHLLMEDFARTDCIAALGGGTVGDIAGFAAATYLHGVPLLHFPTSTTAQCDSAIGGLNNLDMAGFKNVLGRHHLPSAVVIDPTLLASLPKRPYASGLGEAMKTALLFSGDLFEILEKEDIASNIERILCLSLLHKKALIEQEDPSGEQRQLLRFGNTVGQGIEAAGAPGAFLHGEAVALGLLPFIESRTLARRVRAVMRRLGLPTKHPYAPAQLLPYLQKDASREGNMFTVTRVKKLGHGYLERITQEELALILHGG